MVLISTLRLRKKSLSFPILKVFYESKKGFFMAKSSVCPSVSLSACDFDTAAKRFFWFYV